MEASSNSKKRTNGHQGGAGYRALLREIFDGTILTKGFFRENVWMIVIIVTGMLVYIGNHYSVIMDLNKIDDLNQTLADVKYEALTQSSMLMLESRQSRVKELVEEKGLDLVDSKTPPFVIQVEK